MPQLQPESIFYNLVFFFRVFLESYQQMERIKKTHADKTGQSIASDSLESAKNDFISNEERIFEAITIERYKLTDIEIQEYRQNNGKEIAKLSQEDYMEIYESNIQAQLASWFIFKDLLQQQEDEKQQFEDPVQEQEEKKQQQDIKLITTNINMINAAITSFVIYLEQSANSITLEKYAIGIKKDITNNILHARIFIGIIFYFITEVYNKGKKNINNIAFNEYDFLLRSGDEPVVTIKPSAAPVIIEDHFMPRSHEQLSEESTPKSDKSDDELTPGPNKLSLQESFFSYLPKIVPTITSTSANHIRHQLIDFF